MHNEETFTYTYSSQQRSEIENIRKKYLPPEVDKMEQLRKMDQSVYQKAQAGSITMGVVGMLILGTGMSMTMTDFAASLGSFAMVLGIFVGLIGLVLVACAYPAYNRIIKKERERIAPEILKLTDELIK